MKPTEANARPRKKPILISVLVIIPLMGLGLCIVSNLLDTTPPTLTVSGLDRDQRYRGALKLDITAMDEKPGMSSLTVVVAPEEWTERDFSSLVSMQLPVPSGKQK